MTIDDLKFAIQARLFAITRGLHQVVVSHNPPGNVKMMVRLVLRRFQVQLLPDESDLRPVGLITQRLAKVVGVMTRKDGGL